MKDKSINELIELANSNDISVLCELASRFELGEGGAEKDYKKSFEYYLRAAELGDAGAQFWVGYKYFHQQGTEKNDKEMIKWLKKSADQENSMAQWLLGGLYIEGKKNFIDIEENIELGMELLNKSAQSGNEFAKKKLEELKENL